MSSFASFEELEVWKSAREVVREVYTVTMHSKFSSDFALRDQLRRASISIVSNIAEGFERSGNVEFIRFLYIAKGSAGEARAQLYLALDLNYVDSASFKKLSGKLVSVSRQLSAFIGYLEGSPLTVKTVRSVRTSGAARVLKS